jgi:hypothetical protein
MIDYDYLLQSHSGSPTQAKEETQTKSVSLTLSPTPNLEEQTRLAPENEASSLTTPALPKPNGMTERSLILTELKKGVIEQPERQTERFSFEIYVDQISIIEDLQHSYKRKTNKRLSASRIIREALDSYLSKAIKAI